MKREIREAAVYAGVSLGVMLLAGWCFWLHQAWPGALLLGISWGCLAANSFLLGAHYGANQAFDREDAVREQRQSEPEDALQCTNCGCTLFTRAAGAYICLCCGAVIKEKGEDRDGESKM